MSAPRPIFIPGMGSMPDDFAHQAEVFDGCIVHAPDAGGGTASVPMSAGEHAERLAAELGALPGPRVLVGHSLGGAIALETAARRPDLVDGLVVISSGAQIPLAPEALDAVADDFGAECRRLARASFAAATDDEVDARHVALLAAGPDVLSAGYACCRGYDMRDRLAAVEIPALVVAAEDDALTPVWLSEELANGLPMAHMVVVEGSGHLLPIERPAAVSLLVAGYLARLELTLAGM